MVQAVTQGVAQGTEVELCEFDKMADGTYMEARKQEILYNPAEGIWIETKR